MATEHVPPPPDAPTGVSYLEWGAVMGGSAVAVAISIVLTQFAATAGLTLGDPVLASGKVSWQVLAVGLWVILVALASATAGGYIAGRLRSRFGDAKAAEVEFRDGAHGLVVWAVSTAAVALLTAATAAIAAIGGAAVTEVDSAATLPDAVLRASGNISIIFGFATAAGSVLAVAGAWHAAKTGGEHRDANVSVDLATPAWLRKKT